MAVPANSITRVSLQYRVPNVDCITSFHLRNDVQVSNDGWRADQLLAGIFMMNHLRQLQSIAVTYLGGTARVLDHNEIPSIGFSAISTGQVLSDPLPALNYAQVDMYSSAATASGRRVRNAMRVSGIASGFWKDNCLSDGIEAQWLNALRAQAATTVYTGNATYTWVNAYRAGVGLPHVWGFISAVNMRFSARVLSSRQR